VQPAVRVAQIMSRGPQTLRQDTTAQEAARRMQRYGYEGYPVVDEKDRLVGLLTRRAVDRAISHHLNYSAANLMDAGSFTVRPDDSLEHLQRLMTESGWGQIPVVDPGSSEIIGIVTRTDLLKTLTPRPRVPSRRSLAERLEQALPPGRLAILRIVARLAQEQRTAVYIVGGFVRDLILERPSLDFDIVVEEDAITLAKALAARYGGRVTSHLRFSTAKWLIARGAALRLDLLKSDCPELADKLARADLPAALDFVTARTEFYTHPTALPTVERGSIKLDLHRRDFTINTLAVRLDGGHYGELQDYWGGLSDLRSGVVRVLHSLSFVDDPTRILRAVRFEQRFGFRIEIRTLELLREALTLLDRISGDRIRHELDLILAEPRLAQILARLGELGVLAALHPALVWDDWLQERLQRLLSLENQAMPDDLLQAFNSLERKKLVYLLWTLRLAPGHASSLMARLKFSAEMRKLVQSACELWRELPALVEQKISLITARLDDVHPPALVGLYVASESERVQAVLAAYLTRWCKIMPYTDGHALRARGLAPGPRYKEILHELRAAWLDGEIQSEQQEQQRLEQLLVQADMRPGGQKSHS
jgi:tRNA nucleotidyltransferase (CCA-adding enzyme)